LKAQDYDIPLDRSDEDQLDEGDLDDSHDATPTATQSSWAFHQYWTYIDVLLEELREDAQKSVTVSESNNVEEHVRKWVLRSIGLFDDIDLLW